MFNVDRIPTLTRSFSGAAGSGPAIPQAPTAAGILHLGLGNFHRAHQAVYTAAALAAEGGDWGIIGVASRSRAIVDTMRAQDLLYTVAQISPEGTALSIPSAHSDVFVAADEPDRVVRELADPRIRIATLTVTENGYSYAPATGHLDTSDERILADLRGGIPLTTIGQLARGLQARAAIGAPLTILSCDNLAANGKHTERLVREFLTELPGTEGDDVLAFLDQSVAFPSSMVDRIVPSTTDALRQQVATILGAIDGVPVPAEPFTMWAIEDRFAAGRPAWQAGGAIFTDEVGKYEQMKVRLLNGTHSLIAYLGALQGAETIPEAIGLPAIEEAAHTILDLEYEPSVDMPSGVDAGEYKAELFERWANTALAHRTSQVGTDGSVKLGQRIPEPALRALDAGTMPQVIALTVAGYLSCLAPLPRFDPGPHARAMKDAAAEHLIAGGATTGAALAHRAITELELFGAELAARTAFVTRVGELVDIIVRHGVAAAISDAVAAARAPHTAGSIR